MQNIFDDATYFPGFIGSNCYPTANKLHNFTFNLMQTWT